MTYSIIERCSKLNFSPWKGSYEQLAVHFQAAQLEREVDFWNVICDTDDGNDEYEQPHFSIVESLTLADKESASEERQPASVKEGGLRINAQTGDAGLQLSCDTPSSDLRDPIQSSVRQLLTQFGLQRDAELGPEELYEWLLRLKYSPREAERKQSELLKDGSYTVRQMERWWVDLAMSSDLESQRRLLGLEETAQNWGHSPVCSMQKQQQEEELYDDSGTDSEDMNNRRAGSKGQPVVTKKHSSEQPPTMSAAPWQQKKQQRQTPLEGSRLASSGGLSLAGEPEEKLTLIHLDYDNDDSPLESDECAEEESDLWGSCGDFDQDLDDGVDHYYCGEALGFTSLPSDLHQDTGEQELDGCVLEDKQAIGSRFHLAIECKCNVFVTASFVAPGLDVTSAGAGAGAGAGGVPVQLSSDVCGAGSVMGSIVVVRRAEVSMNKVARVVHVWKQRLVPLLQSPAVTGFVASRLEFHHGSSAQAVTQSDTNRTKPGTGRSSTGLASQEGSALNASPYLDVVMQWQRPSHLDQASTNPSLVDAIDAMLEGC